MPKILHTADWQIGRAYNRLDVEDAAALAEARFTAVERLAELARDQGCDLVVVAGDVFDAQTVSDRTIRRTFNALEAFSGPWVLLPGNHDAALAESVWTRARRLKAVPDNVHLALEPGVLELPEQGVAVLAAPLTQRHTYDDLTAAFDQWETSPGLLRIGLAHGCVQGILAEEIDSANPIAQDRAERGRLDYLALGDWHGVKKIDGRTWYSGTPEPERFRNNDAGYALVVDFEQPGAEPVVTPHRTGQHEWQLLHESLTVESDLDAFVEALAGITPNSVLDIRLVGEVTLAGEQRLLQALAEAEARHRSLRCDRSGLRLQPTEADIAALRADGYLGEVIQELRDWPGEPESVAARDALAILASLLREQRTEDGSREESLGAQRSAETTTAAEG
ncbi:metallophosphoesterase family protein [Gilvimarinus sp. F26214L]|uniref:metallophosphoesterase family protein n=1 Tax=Gilvimarinus sp. DZF01 TaxID=3461371 RepID=UPI0040453A63